MNYRNLIVIPALIGLLAACETGNKPLGGGDASLANPNPDALRKSFIDVAGDRVFFEYDSYQLTPQARATLDRQSAWLKQHSALRVVIEGHADERGTREYNLSLGERRAAAVKSYLMGQGLPADRINVVSYGKERPEVASSDETAWSRNRRGVTALPN